MTQLHSQVQFGCAYDVVGLICLVIDDDLFDGYVGHLNMLNIYMIFHLSEPMDIDSCVPEQLQHWQNRRKLVSFEKKIWDGI